jgi:anti-sigma-K factor RskA
MDTERFEELCAGYSLDALESSEVAELAGALRSADPAMLSTFHGMYRAAIALPSSAPSRPGPPPALRQRILASIGRENPVRRRDVTEVLASFLRLDRPRVAIAASFALSALAFALAWYSVILRQALEAQHQEVASLQSELTLQTQRFTALQSEFVRNQELLNVLRSPKIEIVLMNGLTVNPKGYGKIMWDPDKKSAILQISNLPAVPTGKDYQLWVIRGKKPVSAGVFTLNDPSSQSFFKIDELVETNRKAIDAFAITLEPKGGVPQPTGAMYLLGSPTL